MRKDSPVETASTIRPAVARPVNNRGLWVFGAIAVALAAGLFAGLEARRSGITSPATAWAPATPDGSFGVPPELAIPDDQTAYGLVTVPVPILPNSPFADVRPGQLAPTPRRNSEGSRFADTTVPMRQLPDYAASPSLPSQAAGPSLVYQAAADRGGETNRSASDVKSAERVEASMFLNPATTIPKGAIIQAVLETALDSTRAGSARAIVSRDVRGFDGATVLIPRGSRLYGEYKADLAAGQNRALIQWQRLMRPDGAVINLDSPSADPLGRAGVKGKVNTHFFERFGGAILQSALDIGVALAQRSVTDGTVIVGLPGSTQTLINPGTETVKPTLKVAQGMPVSVFVARDLDFTRVQQ